MKNKTLLLAAVSAIALMIETPSSAKAQILDFLQGVVAVESGGVLSSGTGAATGTVRAADDGTLKDAAGMLTM